MQLTIHTDGGSRGNPGTAGAGIVAFDGEKEVYSAAVPLGVKTNNEAEYLAVQAALEWLGEFSQENTVEKVLFVLDSKLVVEQLSRRWKIKEPRLRVLAQECWNALAEFSFPVVFSHVLRHDNTHADLLANQAMDSAE